MSQKNERNERGSATSITPVFFAIAGLAIFGLSRSIILDGNLRDETEFAQNVQGYNSEIHAELAGHYPGLDGLVLTNDDGQRFSFHVQDAQDRTETCKGSYDVRSDIAQVAGPITCSYVVENN